MSAPRSTPAAAAPAAEKTEAKARNEAAGEAAKKADGGGVRVAYQGVAGAYSEQAALQFAPGAEAVGFPSFEEAFAAALSGDCTYACLPVENSLAGSVHPTYDLLTDSSLHVIAEQMVRVRHNLLVRPGTRLEDVRRVYSHPQALAQSSRFLRSRGLTAVVDFDTAGAAKLLSEAEEGNGTQERAAIASRRAAEVYGLDIAAEGIEDESFNYTRFFVMGADEARRGAGPQKTSLVLATRHRPGDLVACLEEFPKRGINMTKLESRPRRDKPWSYLFYVDIEGHADDANVAEAMAALMRKAAFVKYLGSYPAAPPPDELVRP